VSTDSARGPREFRGPLVVRPAVVTDAPSIALVHTRSWQHAYRGQVPDEVLDALDVDVRTARWQQLLAAAPSTSQVVLVAETPDGLVGFATGGPCRDTDRPQSAEVYAIYALPTHWGMGIGAQLMVSVLGNLGGDATAVSLWVIADNARARTFYAGFGFVDDGAERVEVMGGTDVHEQRMVRSPG
jgi:GNAT superfamily N-acetyltransferase